MTPAALTAGLRAWLPEVPALLAGSDADTAAVCLAALGRLCDDDLLARKVAAELDGRGAPWTPVGRVLIVVAEHDLLGTALALLGACATGNRVRIKARHTRLACVSLARALGLGPDACEILDWDSAGQDDAALLADIDAVLLAGGDDLIRHYRRVAPAHVRLIEWGPKLSAAAIGAAADPADGATVDLLAAEVTRFGQRVCSSPQVILVDPAPAPALRAALRARLGRLPVLPADDRLAQLARAGELSLLGRLDSRVEVDLETATGWGITASPRLDPTLWLHRGFHLVIADLAVSLGELAHLYRRRLQTLGTWAVPASLLADHAGFTRICPLGAMHARSPLAPHDGLFELPALVDFLSS